MNKNKNLPYLIGGGLLMVGVGGYFLYKSLKDKKDLKDSRKKDEETPSIPKVGTTSGSPAQTLTKSFPISKGTFNNSYVKELQIALEKDADGKPLVADGDWGNLTEGAMAKFGLRNQTIKDRKELDEAIFGINFSKP
jgi:hypothetical protein